MSSGTGKVLVTGASGLIGSGVAARLRADGVPVVAIDIVPGEGVVACDVTDVAAVGGIVERESVGSVIHCGAFSGPMVAVDRPRAVVDVNIGGTATLLEAARTHGLGRVVYCSSLSVYGPTDPVPVTEETRTHPTSVYAASKAAGESLVLAYAAQHGVDGVALRIAAVYGPGRRTSCFIRDLLDSARAGVPTVVPYAGDVPAQYVYVDDAVEAVVLAWAAPAVTRRVMNVTGPRATTAAEVAEAAAAVVPGTEVRFDPDPGAEEPERQGPLVGDLAAAEIGYRPRWSLAEGIAAYERYLRRAEDTPVH
ncbi:hypothetical protein GCM10009836_12150 [Pseudonocardia ailaonensis]|uniref:NAD-dependent epimerase/dehydratase domain-containing protein n=1 Tax=Pseudonocardia ailaonensis TaxID=367279 RepID=A0ABN2MRR5_9PSEU